jgi:hypothetical protein
MPRAIHLKIGVILSEGAASRSEEAGSLRMTRSLLFGSSVGNDMCH